MKVKFKRTEVCYPNRKEYLVILKNDGASIPGEITIDFSLETIIIDFGRLLSKEEKLEILKEVFYNFCICTSKKYYKENLNDVDTYVVIFKHDESNKKLTLMENLMQYPQNEFKAFNKRECVLAEIITSYNIIKNKGVGKDKERVLQNLEYDLDETDIIKYENILQRYLKEKGYTGTLRRERGLNEEDRKFINPNNAYFRIWYYVHHTYVEK